MRVFTRTGGVDAQGARLTIIAGSFARIFLQNAINLGLRIVTAPGFEASPGDEVEIGEQEVYNRTRAKQYAIVRLPAARQTIIDAGGLIAYTRRRLAEQQSQ